jgi:SAM-dependent methyltransferase
MPARSSDRKSLEFWEQPEQVEQFAKRDPDHRLIELTKQYADPGSVRVLDLGCAGGRNVELLLRAGFDTHALDGSRGMVDATRARVTNLVSAEELTRRIFQGRIDDLSFAADRSFDLMVALGIFQVAQTDDEWERALAEAARVLRPGGRALVSNFAPGTGPLDTPPRKVEGTRLVYEGFRAGPTCLLTAAEVDAEFRRIGLIPEVPTETVERHTEDQRRVTVNALYRKAERP